MFQAIITTLTCVIGDVMNRFLMSKQKVSWQKFVTIAYIFFTILLIPGVYIFVDFNDEIFKTKYLFLLLLCVLLTIGYSIFRNIGFKELKIEIIEPLILTQWVFSVFLAYLFFPDERNLFKIGLAIISFLCIFLVNINFKKFKFLFNRYYYYVIFSVIFASFNTIVIKYLLEEYNPILLAFFRAFFVSLILLCFIRISKKDIMGKSKYYFILGLLDAIGIIFLFWSYQVVGIVTTAIVTSLQPLISQWLSTIILKEKLHWKNIIATFIIIICIIISLFV
jgi:drug/metabolite transporter (DMT)-like permease